MTAGQAPGSGVSCKVSVTGDPPQSEILSENSRNNAEVLKRSYRIALLSCSSLLAVAINLFLRLNRNFITDQETGPERTTGEPHNAFSPAPPPVEEARPQEVSCHRGWRRCPGGGGPRRKRTLSTASRRAGPPTRHLPAGSSMRPGFTTSKEHSERQLCHKWASPGTLQAAAPPMGSSRQHQPPTARPTRGRWHSRDAASTQPAHAKWVELLASRHDASHNASHDQTPTPLFSVWGPLLCVAGHHGPGDHPGRTGLTPDHEAPASWAVEALREQTQLRADTGL